ncbi:MAG: PP2C family protein-serine/threonine phosphatase, partial [Tepidisphaeraceae bacterium]
AALATLDAELKVVGSIQRSLLPRELPPIPGFELAAFYQTSARAGGDYYDFFPLGKGDGGGEGAVGGVGSWGLFIADVSGHGTPAAVLMAITHALAHARPGTHTPPAEMLRHLNQDLTRSYTSGGTFVTAFYAVLDPVARMLTYSMAGHNPPRLVRADQVLSLNNHAAMPLGIMDDETYHQGTIALERGDLLLLYTDGITEAMAPLRGAASRDLFGTERLDQLLLTCASSSADNCLIQIRTAVTAFCEAAPPTDDQTLIAIRCL